MRNAKTLKPFGILFEEEASSEGFEYEPIYSEKADISLIRNENGDMVPFVDYLAIRPAHSFTKAYKEKGDEIEYHHPHTSLSVTFTATTVQKEQTDQDPGGDIKPNSNPSLTRTQTAYERESMDAD